MEIVFVSVGNMKTQNNGDGFCDVVMVFVSVGNMKTQNNGVGF